MKASHWWLACMALALARTTLADYTVPTGAPGSEASRMRTMNEVEPRRVVYALPHTITESGAYTLVSNLTGIAGQSGITINANDVTLDLNGFGLFGSPTSTDGVILPGGGTQILICNGTISGWGSRAINGLGANNSRLRDLVVVSNGYNQSQIAISIGTNAIVERCVVLGNKSTGLTVGGGSKVSGCTVRNNGGGGVVGAKDSIYSDSTATGNLTMGFYTKDNSVIANCNAVSNGTHGFYADDNTMISHCVSGTNTQDGFHVGRGCVLENCAAQGNRNGFYVYAGTVARGCSAYGNTNDGFYAQSQEGATFAECTSMNNGGDGFDVSGGSTVSSSQASGHKNVGCAGIRLSSMSVATRNLCMGNYHGIYASGRSVVTDNGLYANTNGAYVVASSYCLVLQNKATSNLTTNYYLPSGTCTYGPVFNGPGVVTNVNPWANIAF